MLLTTVFYFWVPRDGLSWLPLLLLFGWASDAGEAWARFWAAPEVPVAQIGNLDFQGPPNRGVSHCPGLCPTRGALVRCFLSPPREERWRRGARRSQVLLLVWKVSEKPKERGGKEAWFRKMGESG